MSDPTTKVHHPDHYNQHPMECIDVLEIVLTREEYRGYLLGNALEYRWRAGSKPGAPAETDMEKAAWYEIRLSGQPRHREDPYAKPVGSMTRNEIHQGLANLGIDVTCGACMEMFYTGMTRSAHDCPNAQTLAHDEAAVGPSDSIGTSGEWPWTRPRSEPDDRPSHIPAAWTKFDRSPGARKKSYDATQDRSDQLKRGDDHNPDLAISDEGDILPSRDPRRHQHHPGCTGDCETVATSLGPVCGYFVSPTDPLWTEKPQ